MKILALVILSAYYSATAFAHNKEWITYWPRVNGVSIQNLCLDGDVFRSIDPVRLCVSHAETRKACIRGDVENCRVLRAGQNPYPTEHLKTEVTCTRYENESVAFPRKRLVNKCLAYEPVNDVQIGACTRWTQREELAPLTYRIDVYRDHYGEGVALYSHSFTHTISECL